MSIMCEEVENKSIKALTINNEPITVNTKGKLVFETEEPVDSGGKDKDTGSCPKQCTCSPCKCAKGAPACHCKYCKCKICSGKAPKDSEGGGGGQEPVNCNCVNPCTCKPCKDPTKNKASKPKSTNRPKSSSNDRKC